MGKVDVYVAFQSVLFLVTATYHKAFGEIDNYEIFLSTDQDIDLYPFLSSAAIESITNIADEIIIKDFRHGY